MHARKRFRDSLLGGARLRWRFRAALAATGSPTRAFSLHARANAIASDPAHEDGIFFLGPDHAGQLLEVLARQTPEGLVVFHAMPLSPKYRRRYLP